MTDTSKAMLAASIRVGIFGNRESIEEALEYASEIIDNLQTYDKAVVYTALHVVLNTVADKIAELPDSGDQLPEPPPEVQIDHADLPATGEQSLNEKIADIVDQRILYHSAALNQLVERKVEKEIQEWNENTKFDTIIEEWFEENVDIEHAVKDIINDMSFSISVD